MRDLRFSVGDGREFLAKHDLLGQLTPEELDRLLAPARVERLDEGRVLFRKGDPGDKLYVVLAGRISIGTTSEDGKEVVFNVLGRGEVFGEIALLDGKARTADATAMAEWHLLVLDRSDFPRDKVCAGWVTPQVMQALAVDLDDYGAKRVLQPIRVRWNDEHGKWVIVSGERRWRATQLCGLQSIACIFC